MATHYGNQVVSIRFPQPTKQRLDVVAMQYGTDVSTVVRSAVEYYLTALNGQNTQREAGTSNAEGTERDS